MGLRLAGVVLVFFAARALFRRLGNPKRRGNSSVPLLAAICFFAVFVLVPCVSLRRQLGGHHILNPRGYAKKYLAQHGRYPATLAELCRQHGATDDLPSLCKSGKDRWGHPIHYESRRDRFIIVSYGADGKPDGTDYWRVREQESYRNVCGDLDADYVQSDRGEHQGCGK